MNSLNLHRPDSTESDLEWLAFRYVSGEMPADEAATFEELLAENQAAREAVAAAVQVAQAVLASTPAQVATPVVSPRQNTWRERIAWMVLGATAACVALVVAWDGLNRPSRGEGARREVALSPEQASEVHRVVALWSEGSGLAPDEFDFAAEPATDDDAEVAVRLHDVQVPGWMLAAVCPPSDENGPEDN